MKVVRATILIVENVEPCATTLEIALAEVRNLDVRVVFGGRQAAALLAAPDELIAALITDLHMPWMDGADLISLVRSQSRHRNLPIIVVSGDTDPRTPERILAHGANAYFAKPYSPAAVRQKLEELLNVDPLDTSRRDPDSDRSPRP